MPEPSSPTLTDRLVLELQGRAFTLALQPVGEGFPMTGTTDELAEVWPRTGTWQLVALDQLTGKAYPAKVPEISALIAARRALDAS